MANTETINSTPHHIAFPQDAPVFVGEWLRQTVSMTSDDCTPDELAAYAKVWRDGGWDALDRLVYG